MPRTLFTKLSLALSALLLGIGLLYGIISTYLANQYQQELLQNLNRNLAENLITDRNLVKDGVLNQKALKETFHHYMMVNPSIEIYLLDMKGAILSYSAEPGKVKRKYIDLKPIHDFLEGGDFPLLGDDPRNVDRKKIFSVTMVPSENNDHRYLYVVLRGEEYDRAEKLFQKNFLTQLSGTALMISLVFGLVTGLILFRLLTNRLQKLTLLMRGFQKSNFVEHVPYPEHAKRDDEIEMLGQHYNQMAERIRDQFADLKKQDELRRELVANVSHDLRTPLAALHGYIETLKLKAEDFDPATRAEYLETALKHSQRLTRLVEELFELAKLDARETRLLQEPFAPAELVQDIVQKFKLPAEERNVKLKMENPGQLPFVYADIYLIERVLENLISNALRYTSAGGEITVRLKEVDSVVEIGVQDTGSGISEENLPYIFDRFYRGDNKERSGHHSGLGLAIAQHIIKLHGSEIRVESQYGKGSLFSFMLPVHQK